MFRHMIYFTIVFLISTTLSQQQPANTNVKPIGDIIGTRAWKFDKVVQPVVRVHFFGYN